MADVDVLIIGGGPAGCTTALSLVNSRPGATVLVLDDSDPNAFKASESLPPEAIQILRHLSPGLADSVRQVSHLQCIGNASIWEAPEVRDISGMMNPYGYGLHLDRAAFDESLRKAVFEASPSSIVKARFISVDKVDGVWSVISKSLEYGEERSYRAKWLVDATGRKASIAQKIGAKTVKSDDVLSFYAVFSTNAPDHDHRTLIEATEPGWFYSAQLPNQRRLVAFHTSGSSPTAKLVRRLPGFLSVLNEYSTLIRETIESCDYFVDESLSVWPKVTAAGSSHAEPFGSLEDRWCTVGDAAMAFDPLSSQGMITALKCGCMLGMALAEDSAELKPLGAVYEDIRRDYETKRKWFYGQAMFDGADFWNKQKQ
ncbi:hypothetical protein FRB99_002991 [Tulasnella sp. 403]|nr:hypothetical protein FRB99_002991 [Tulasnella sp. 403]